MWSFAQGGKFAKRASADRMVKLSSDYAQKWFSRGDADEVTSRNSFHFLEAQCYTGKPQI